MSRRRKNRNPPGRDCHVGVNSSWGIPVSLRLPYRHGALLLHLILIFLFVIVEKAPGQLTRQQAVDALLAPASGVNISTNDTVWSPFVDFGLGAGFEGLLPATAQVDPAETGWLPFPGPGMTATNASYFFWIDEEPVAAFQHPVRFALVDAFHPTPSITNGAIRVTAQGWWPIVTLTNGPATEYFGVDTQRVSASAPGFSNPDGLVAGFAPHPDDLTLLPGPPFAFGASAAAADGFDNACALIVRGSPETRMANNVSKFANNLINHFGVNPGRIIYANNGLPATKAQLCTAITNVCNLVPACDKIYVRLASHGSIGGFTLVGGTIPSFELCNKFRILAKKDVPICMVISGCHTESLIDWNAWGFPKDSSIITTAGRNQVSWGGGFLEGNLSAHVIALCQAMALDPASNPGLDLNSDGFVDDREAHAWVVLQKPALTGHSGRKYYPAGPPLGQGGLNPNPQIRIARCNPLITSRIELNYTQDEKTDFHLRLCGDVAEGVETYSSRVTSDGLILPGLGFTNEATVTYDAEKDETEIAWEDTETPVPKGSRVIVTVSHPNGEGGRVKSKFWTPLPPVPPPQSSGVTNFSPAGGTWYHPDGNPSNVLVAVGTPPALDENEDETQDIDVRVGTARSFYRMRDFHPGNSELQDMGTTNKFLQMEPDRYEEFEFPLEPQPKDAPLPSLIIFVERTWAANSNSVMEMSEAPLPLPPADTTCTNLCPGEGAVMTVNLADGDFQWYCNGTALPGETNATLVVTNLTKDQNGTIYTGIGTNATTCKRKFFKNIVVDEVAPEISCPTNLVVECDLPGGAVVNFIGSLSVTDACGQVETVVCDPLPGSFFPLGATPVRCVATDTCGNSNECTFTITVVDTAPPELFCGDFVLTNDSPLVINYSIGVSDQCDTNPVVVCNPPPGSQFPVGTTPVTCSATDASGNTGNCMFNITIVPSGGPPPATGDPGEANNGNIHYPVGDPVSGFSGGFYFTEQPDLDLGGPLRIFLQRHYDSMLFEDGFVDSPLGGNWQHNYDIALSVEGTNATAVYRQGRILRFDQVGTNWIISGRTDIPFQLLETGPEFALADPRSQFLYLFDTNGLLQRIEDGRGNTNRLTHAGGRLIRVTDDLNRNLDFFYDPSGRLTNVTDGIRSVSYGHTGSNLTAFVDALGQVSAYTYDPASTNNPALMRTRTFPEGNTPLQNDYDSFGRVVSQTESASNTSFIGYGENAGQRMTTFTNAVGDSQTQIYNPGGELTLFTDEAGNSIDYESDAAGRRNRITDRRGHATEITYDDASGFPGRIDLPENEDELFFYTNRTMGGVQFFNLSRAVHPDSTTNRYAYDAQGNLVIQTNRHGDVWNYGYDDRGQLLSVMNPLSGELEFTYDANARLVSSTDSGVGITTYEYDALNRLTNIVHPDSERIGFTFDPLNRLRAVTDERGNTTSFEYDGNDRRTNITDALNQNLRFEYDDVNRLSRSVDSLGHTVGFRYDSRGLLESVSNRNGLVTRFEYDERRRFIGSVSPAGVTNRLAYDEEGLLTASVNPLGETLRLERDAMGFVTRFIDPLSNTVELVRDDLKRVTGITDPLGHTTTFDYDSRGLLTGAALELGIAAAYRYDSLGSLTNVTDSILGRWDLGYTASGRLSDFSDPLGRTTAYAYDPLGRFGSVEFADRVTLSNVYDAAGNPTQLNYSDGVQLHFAYDPLNRLTNAVGSDPVGFAYDAMGRVTNTRARGLDFGAGYDPGGRLTNVTYNSGQLVVSYTYDNRDRLVHAGDSLTGQGMDFTYDDADQLTGITRSNGVVAAYTYDAAGRLTRIQENSFIDIRYTRDAKGRVSEADYISAPIDPTAVLTDESASFIYDTASQVAGAGHLYDARGRLTNAPAFTLEWDGASRLVGIDTVRLGYNALNNLVTRDDGASTTNRYFYNYALQLEPIVAERNEGTGQFSRFYVWSPAGLLLYIIELPGASVRYPHFDQVGSTLALTDEAGTVTDAYAYGPYGRPLSQFGTSTQPFRFNGQFGVRKEGSLYHMRARWFDPVICRFTSKEPLWPALGNPKKLNPYQFALSDPVRYVDPLGTDDVDTSEGPVPENYPNTLADSPGLARGIGNKTAPELTRALVTLILIARKSPDPVEHMKVLGVRGVLDSLIDKTYFDPLAEPEPAPGPAPTHRRIFPRFRPSGPAGPVGGIIQRTGGATGIGTPAGSRAVPAGQPRLHPRISLPGEPPSGDRTGFRIPAGGSSAPVSFTQSGDFLTGSDGILNLQWNDLADGNIGPGPFIDASTFYGDDYDAASPGLSLSGPNHNRISGFVDYVPY